VEDAWTIWRVRAAQNAALAANYPGAIEILTARSRVANEQQHPVRIGSVYMTQHDYDEPSRLQCGDADAAAGDYARCGAAFASGRISRRTFPPGRATVGRAIRNSHLTAMNALERERYSDGALLSATLQRYARKKRDRVYGQGDQRLGAKHKTPALIARAGGYELRVDACHVWRRTSDREAIRREHTLAGEEQVQDRTDVVRMQHAYALLPHNHSRSGTQELIA